MSDTLPNWLIDIANHEVAGIEDEKILLTFGILAVDLALLRELHVYRKAIISLRFDSKSYRDVHRFIQNAMGGIAEMKRYPDNIRGMACFVPY